MNDIQNSAITAPAVGGLGGTGFAMRRIGIFYDGGHFLHISNFYNYKHERKARLYLRGIHDFVCEAISQLEGVDRRFCQIVDAHYFRGRLGANQVPEGPEGSDLLHSERQFDEVLIREGITTHFLPLAKALSGGGFREKGIDVWFALEAFELAVLKRFDVCVLVTGDSDFVPLVRKLNTLGSRVMLLTWNLDNGKTRTSKLLSDAVTYSIDMHDLIESVKPDKHDDESDEHKLSSELKKLMPNFKKLINNLFVQQSSPPEKHSHEQPDQEQPVDAPDEQGMKTGKVVMVNSTDRYGFIQPEGAYTRDENAHFHFKDVAEGTDPTGLKHKRAREFLLG